MFSFFTVIDQEMIKDLENIKGDLPMAVPILYGYV
jgi:hypothetical protein